MLSTNVLWQLMVHIFFNNAVRYKAHPSLQTSKSPCSKKIINMTYKILSDFSWDLMYMLDSEILKKLVLKVLYFSSLSPLPHLLISLIICIVIILCCLMLCWWTPPLWKCCSSSIAASVSSHQPSFFLNFLSNIDSANRWWQKKNSLDYQSIMQQKVHAVVALKHFLQLLLCMLLQGVGSADSIRCSVLLYYKKHRFTTFMLDHWSPRRQNLGTYSESGYSPITSLQQLMHKEQLSSEHSSALQKVGCDPVGAILCLSWSHGLPPEGPLHASWGGGIWRFFCQEK